MISVEPHPLLDLVAFRMDLPRPLSEVASPAATIAFLGADVNAPLQRDEEVRQAVRDLLRHGGYKPTGRGKPASEYLVRAAEERTLGAINALVDACNAASLHSGLPISVVDADLARDPLTVGIAAPGSRYVFNATGQEIDVSGLVVMRDADGPTASPVKDSHRTKTHAATRSALALIWGTRAAPGLATRTGAWFRELAESAGATTSDLD